MELIKAIHSRNNDKTRDLLERIDASAINEVNSEGATPLHTAARANNVEAVAKLLSIPGINVNARSNSGLTPIMSAARNCTSEALRELLGHPAVDVNARNNDGWTAVMLAARNCRIEALRALLDHPAVDLDVKSKNGGGLEDVVGRGIRANLANISKPKCLELIQNARRKRETISLDFSECGNCLEDMRINVRKAYTDKIDKVNQQVQANETKLKNNVELRKTEIKNLEEKLDLESNQKKSKLEQELVRIQNEIKKHVEEMEKKYNLEKAILEDQFEKVNEEIRHQLLSLKEMANQLAKELRKQDMDPDHLEAARDTLECPVCMEIMRPPKIIFMCPSNHLVCEACKDQLEGGLCPTCRTEQVSLRALLAEKFARTLFNN